MRYSVAWQSVTEQQEMLVPGTSRLRNHGPSVGSASAGGCAPAVVGSSNAAARNRRLMTLSAASPMPMRGPRGAPHDSETGELTGEKRRCTASVYHKSTAANSLHRQAGMNGAAVERGKLWGERRDGDLSERLRRPTALTVDHTQRPHMPIERQLAGPLVEDLAVDMAGLFGSEKDAERGDRVGPAAAQTLLADCRHLRVLRGRDRPGHAGVRRRANNVDGNPLRSILHRDDARQRHDSELGCTVIALPDIAEQARGRRHHDHPPVALLAKQVDRRPVEVEVAGQVNVDHRLPVLW